jgi:hypothetical protein
MTYNLYVGHAKPSVRISPHFGENILRNEPPQVPSVTQSMQQGINHWSS